MPAARYDIELEEGADFVLELEYVPNPGEVLDVTGFGAEMEVRTSPGGGTSLLTASVGNGRINVSGETSVFAIRIPVASIDGLTSELGDGTKAYWDMFIWAGASSPSVEPIKLLEGRVRYDRAVTEKG